jgi:hypothetical protein
MTPAREPDQCPGRRSLSARRASPLPWANARRVEQRAPSGGEGARYQRD